jgi:hypothetical protein
MRINMVATGGIDENVTVTNVSVDDVVFVQVAQSFEDTDGVQANLGIFGAHPFVDVPRSGTA